MTPTAPSAAEVPRDQRLSRVAPVLAFAAVAVIVLGAFFIAALWPNATNASGSWGMVAVGFGLVVVGSWLVTAAIVLYCLDDALGRWLAPAPDDSTAGDP